MNHLAIGRIHRLQHHLSTLVGDLFDESAGINTQGLPATLGVILAYRWIALPFYMNLVAVVVLVPAVYLMVLSHGAVGAATVWVALNAAYVLVGLQFMHRRILPGELRGWYVVDVAYPLAAALLVAGMGRWFLQYPLPAPLELVVLTGIAVLTFCASVIAAPATRAWIFHQILNRKVRHGAQN